MKRRRAKRVLVYRIGQLGDTVVALPAIRAVREYLGGAYFALLCDSHSGKGYVSACQILAREYLFDEFISYPTSLSGVRVRDLLGLVSRLRRGCFDTLVYLAPRLRSRGQILRDLVFFRLAGITRFLGHRGIEPPPRRVPGLPLPNQEHETDHLLRRLAVDGVPVPPAGNAEPALRLTDSEVGQARAWLAAQLGGHPGRPVIAIGAGAKVPSKIWPHERFVELGHQLIAEFGALPIVFGGPEVEASGDRLIAQWAGGINAAGKLSVRQAAALLALCTLYVGNDTGTMHLAAAAGTRCVAIFAAVDWPGRWYPYGRQHIVLRGTVPCEGCRLRECVEYDSACLKQISVSEAMAACRKAFSFTLLSGQPRRVTSVSHEISR